MTLLFYLYIDTIDYGYINLFYVFQMRLYSYKSSARMNNVNKYKIIYLIIIVQSMGIGVSMVSCFDVSYFVDAALLMTFALLKIAFVAPSFICIEWLYFKFKEILHEFLLMVKYCIMKYYHTYSLFGDTIINTVCWSEDEMYISRLRNTSCICTKFAEIRSTSDYRYINVFVFTSLLFVFVNTTCICKAFVDVSALAFVDQNTTELRKIM